MARTKLSLHSGSDKFSVYPCWRSISRGAFTSRRRGQVTSKPCACWRRANPTCSAAFGALARERYAADRATYHVSAELKKVTAADLPALLDDFHAREILHVTFGSVLARFGADLKPALVKHADSYAQALQTHFIKHLRLLNVE